MTTNYSHTKISDIDDSDFQSLVSELCLCADLGRDQFLNHPLSYLLMAIGRENRALTAQHLPLPGVLTRKVGKLSPDSVVHNVCRELVDLKKTHIESFDGKTVLSLIKHCHKAHCPQAPRPKKQPRHRRAYQAQTRLIQQRRRNGDL